MSRFEPGPVFLFECITAARRWQFYVGRAIFVGALLVALLVVWHGQLGGRQLASIGRDAEAGEKFFYGVVGTELALLLLVAPAATASAICVDKSRGTLAHIFVTDLSNAEIIRGKLAARFLPVFGLILSTAPVMFLATLLGGIDPEALAGSLVVMLGTAVLTATIALTLSVWAHKTHEVLLGTYAIVALWLLAKPLWTQLAGYVLLGSAAVPAAEPRVSVWTVVLHVLRGWDPTVIQQWLEDTNPAYLVFAPYRHAGASLWFQYWLFLGICLALSSILVAISVWRVRSVFVRQSAQTISSKPRSKTLAAWRRFSDLLPGPTLDSSPVLWREWRRNRPSSFVQWAWLAYAMVAGLASVVAAVNTLTATGWAAGNMAAWVNALQVSVGLLLLSVLSATSLADERARGSLELLLATPLTTRAIVWGKFWGTYRFVPMLAVLPTFVMGVGLSRNGHAGHMILAVAMILTYGAAITSFGILMATWLKRLSRAVISTVSAYVLVAVGWLFLVMAVARSGGRDTEGLLSASPFMSLGSITYEICSDQFQAELFGWRLFWCGTFAVASAVLMVAALASFDRCVGRMPDWNMRFAQMPPRSRYAAREPVLLHPIDSCRTILSRAGTRPFTPDPATLGARGKG